MPPRRPSWWETALGDEEIYRITGTPLHAMFAINKIMWLRTHASGRCIARAERFLSVGDYLLLQMGFPPYTDPSLASRTMGFDIHRRAWSPEILAAAGLKEEQLGIVLPAGDARRQIVAHSRRAAGAAGRDDGGAGRTRSTLRRAGGGRHAARTGDRLLRQLRMPGRDIRAPMQHRAGPRNTP